MDRQRSRECFHSRDYSDETGGADFIRAQSLTDDVETRLRKGVCIRLSECPKLCGVVNVRVCECHRARSLPRQRLPRPRRLGFATATTSATFFPDCEHRIRSARAANVAERPAIRASASGSICRNAPQGQVTRTRQSRKQSSSLLMWGSTRTGRMVLTAGAHCPCSCTPARALYEHFA